VKKMSEKNVMKLRNEADDRKGDVRIFYLTSTRTLMDDGENQPFYYEEQFVNIVQVHVSALQAKKESLLDMNDESVAVQLMCVTDCMSRVIEKFR